MLAPIAFNTPKYQVIESEVIEGLSGDAAADHESDGGGNCEVGEYAGSEQEIAGAQAVEFRARVRGKSRALSDIGRDFPRVVRILQFDQNEGKELAFRGQKRLHSRVGRVNDRLRLEGRGRLMNADDDSSVIV